MRLTEAALSSGPRTGSPDIRWRSIASAAMQIDTWKAGITPTERIEAARFRQAADQHRFIVGRALVRQMIAARLGCRPLDLDIGRDERGKPFLVGATDITFSVSHSGDIVMVAVAEGQVVGVDVEHHRPDLDIEAVGRMVYTPAEMRRILTAPPGARLALFYRQWVTKEALVKALGTGLLRDPRRFQVRYARDAVAVDYVGEDADDVGTGWRITALDVPAGYSASLCLRDLAPREDAILAA